MVLPFSFYNFAEILVSGSCDFTFFLYNNFVEILSFLGVVVLPFLFKNFVGILVSGGCGLWFYPSHYSILSKSSFLRVVVIPFLFYNFVEILVSGGCGFSLHVFGSAWVMYPFFTR